MYKELLELHSQLEAPYGHMMNPLLYANQNPVYHYPMVSFTGYFHEKLLKLLFPNSRLVLQLKDIEIFPEQQIPLKFSMIETSMYCDRSYFTSYI